MNKNDRELVVECVRELSVAIRRIASGDASPDGLEAVAMALSGEGLGVPVSSALVDLADKTGSGLDRVAESLHEVARALNRVAKAAENSAGEV